MPDLVEELRFYAAKQKWPKGLEGMPDLLSRAASALSSDAKPDAWRWRFTDSKEWCEATLVEPNENQRSAFIIEALYTAPPAPPVAVKALETAIHNGLIDSPKLGSDSQADFNRAKEIILSSVLSALSAQVQDVDDLLDAAWDAAVEQAAAIANDCVHLTPDPGAAIKTMLNGRVKLHTAAPTAAPKDACWKDPTIFNDAEGRN